MSALLPNLLHFGRLLYQLGLDVPAGRMREVAASLNYINICLLYTSPSPRDRG